MSNRQWSDKYGARWYLYRDGIPPQDDDNSYVWTGSQWSIDYDYEDEIDEDALEEYEYRKRQKLALTNEF